MNHEIFTLNFGIEGKVIYPPGHTAGSISLLLDPGEAFIGCLAHNRLPFTPGPRLPIYAEDIEKTRESWNMLIERGARVAYPGHGKRFHINKIKI